MNKNRNREEHQRYMTKLNQSYIITREELKEPEPDWEEKIHETKFTIDKLTNKPKTEHTFILNHPDEIDVSLSNSNNRPVGAVSTAPTGRRNLRLHPTWVQHNYVFKRSAFYEKFKKPKSRLRNELMEYYRSKKFTFVDLFYNDLFKKWCLKLYWENTEIQFC